MNRKRITLLNTQLLITIMMIAITARAEFIADLDSHDGAVFHRANGWTNGSPFDVGWRSDHVDFSNSIMTLTLDDQPCSTDTALCSGKNYASGEYRTNDFYHYGRVETRMKAASGAGLISSLFTYTGSSDGNQHDEIDIEFKGANTNQVQFNYYSNGVGGHEYIHTLGFDAAAEFHTYAFEWRTDSISWFVDNTEVYSVSGHDMPVTAGRIMTNLWAVDNSVSAWAGTFSGTVPVTAEYDYISFSNNSTLIALPDSVVLMLLPLLFLFRYRLR